MRSCTARFLEDLAMDVLAAGRAVYGFVHDSDPHENLGKRHSVLPFEARGILGRACPRPHAPRVRASASGVRTRVRSRALRAAPFLLRCACSAIDFRSLARGDPTHEAFRGLSPGGGLRGRPGGRARSDRAPARGRAGRPPGRSGRAGGSGGDPSRVLRAHGGARARTRYRQRAVLPHHAGAAGVLPLVGNAHSHLHGRGPGPPRPTRYDVTIDTAATAARGTIAVRVPFTTPTLRLVRDVVPARGRRSSVVLPCASTSLSHAAVDPHLAVAFQPTTSSRPRPRRRALRGSAALGPSRPRRQGEEAPKSAPVMIKPTEDWTEGVSARGRPAGLRDRRAPPPEAWLRVSRRRRTRHLCARARQGQEYRPARAGAVRGRPRCRRACDPDDYSPSCGGVTVRASAGR